MRYLLDTHVILWAAENSPLLTEKAKIIFLDRNAEKYISMASVWEVAVKLGTKKLQLEGGLPEFFRMIDENGLYILYPERVYLEKIPDLPDYHRDPFDRLIIATAISENMGIITIDGNFQKYNVTCIW